MEHFLTGTFQGQLAELNKGTLLGPCQHIGRSFFTNIVNDFWQLQQQPPERCSMKKGVLRNFRKSIGKYLCQGLFFNKIAGLMPAILFKKRL